MELWQRGQRKMATNVGPKQEVAADKDDKGGEEKGA